MLLQWPHQGAKNFTKTFLSDPRTEESKFLSVARNAEAFAKEEKVFKVVKKEAKMRNDRSDGDLVVVIVKEVDYYYLCAL
jgi:hypothetical protein